MFLSSQSSLEMCLYSEKPLSSMYIFHYHLVKEGLQLTVTDKGQLLIFQSIFIDLGDTGSLIVHVLHLPTGNFYFI